MRWGGKAGPDVVGQRIRRLRTNGQWIAGLLVQSNEIARDRYVHRVVWDDGRPDEWLCLQEYRWLLERDYRKMAAAAAGKGARGRQPRRQGSDAVKPSGAGGKRARAKRERAAARRHAGALDQDKEDSDSDSASDSFIASSDEVMPRRARRARAPARARRAPGAGRGRTGRRNLFPHMTLADGESPLQVPQKSPTTSKRALLKSPADMLVLQSQYVRGVTPPLPVDGNESWIDVVEAHEQQRRAQVEAILSARDLPLRIATLRCDASGSRRCVVRAWGLRGAGVGVWQLG
jgi:hypothetical protein